ncbi:MAG: SDR family NAD(P)-dependent oxidoreductase, partial [Candidatus Eremiobacteraeota bacterium]|nr:SDR family NAD(P)-dependent oxidoreductase [Candidatus Eremiobacteraeota bacterium]
DVTDRSAIAAAVESVSAAGVPLVGLVNNAGIAIGGPLEFLPVDELRRQFEVNVFGALAVTQAFLPLLRAAHGRIVFVGSISGRLAIPFIGPYSASKFALRAISDALRNELAGAGIAVALVEPGSVKTPIWRKGREGRKRLLEILPPDAHRLYGEVLSGVFAQTEREEQVGMPVERVSAAILHALGARRPRANYVVGGAAKAGSVVAMLPAGVRDRAFRAARFKRGRRARGS